MPVIPSPLPDEMARGYLGRIGSLNGLSDEAQIVSALRCMGGSEPADCRQSAVVELLALAAQCDLSAFLQHHTLLPYRKIVANRPVQDGLACTHYSLLQTQGMRPLRKGGYFCPQCVSEDIDFHGQSYWRRQHQLPGQLLCAKHGQGLCFVDSDNAFLKPPSVFCETASIEVCGNSVRAAVANPLHQRFFDIWSGLAERGQSIYSGVAARVFREKARALGIATLPGQVRRPWLSDRIVESFGARWLAALCPRLAKKSPCCEFPSIDQHILVNNGKSLAHYYVLIAAVLFETADEALLALVNLQPSDLGRTGRSFEKCPGSGGSTQKGSIFTN